MQSPDPLTPERQAILSALRQIERRLRLNRLLHAAALTVGLVLLGLVTWRLLHWLDAGAPAASALVVLLAALGAIGLLLGIAVTLVGGSVAAERAAAEADARAGLHDELTSAFWFMRGGDAAAAVARDWIGLQLRRAAVSARALRPSRIVPLRLPRPATAGLAAGFVVLVAVWGVPPMAPAQSRAAGAGEGAGSAQLRAMREAVAALPESDAARRLEEALKVLDSSTATAEERRLALAQAHGAVDQIRLDAAVSREGLQRLSQMLSGQQGLEEVAEALASGDAERAAELLAQAQADHAGGAGDAGQPADVTGEKPSEDALQQALNAVTEAQGSRPGAEALQLTVDRLKEIARELQVASYVNQAWQQVQGPQLQAARADTMSAGRFGEQAQETAASNPSPATGNTPMGGGTLFRSAALAQGPGTEEQEGGSRMGDAIGDAPPDPLLAEAGERLEAQLRHEGISGAQGEDADENQNWFYTESERRDARSEWQAVQVRERFADAEAALGQGISIQHRRIVKNYFTQQREENP